MFVVEVCPVGVWEAGADLGYGFTNGALGVCEVWVMQLKVFRCAGVDGAGNGEGRSWERSD